VFVVVGICGGKYFTRISNNFDWKFATNIVPSFVCAALLTTCVFLMIPEAITFLTEHVESIMTMEAEESGHDDHEGHDHLRFLEEHEEDSHVETEGPVAWRFGISLLCGFLFPRLSSMVFPRHDHSEPSETQSSKTGKGEVEEGTHDKDEECATDKIHDHTAVSESINYSCVSSILLGDFVHNFVDGVLVGTAFKMCNRQMGISVALATVYHEVAQEIADYFILTTYCNLSVPVALVLNFLSGFSVMLGAIIVLSVEVGSGFIGCILAIGAGVYIYVATIECMANSIKAQVTVSDKILSLVSFFLGALLIGLALLDHQHCDVH